MWGNSRITSFGLTRLAATFLEAYIHSIHLKNTGNLTDLVDNQLGRIAGLWTCAHNTFLNELTQACEACADTCVDGCVRPTADNCRCWDIECADCRDFNEGAECNSCGLLTSFGKGNNTPCDCKVAFTRDVSNGGAFTNFCAAVQTTECLSSAPRCSECIGDTGNWWADCVTCGEGYFRQFDTGSCLTSCPTGSTPDADRNCSDPSKEDLSGVTFDKTGDVYKGDPHGTYSLKEGENGEPAPVNTGDRGLYFEEGSTLTVDDLTLNTNFSFSTDTYMEDIGGDFIDVETDQETSSGESEHFVTSCN